MYRMQELMDANTYANVIKNICSFSNTVIPVIEEEQRD